MLKGGVTQHNIGICKYCTDLLFRGAVLVYQIAHDELDGCVFCSTCHTTLYYTLSCGYNRRALSLQSVSGALCRVDHLGAIVSKASELLR